MPGGNTRSRMASRQDLVVRDEPAAAPPAVHQPGQPVDPVTLGHTLAASGFFPDARDAAQAAVKVMAGRELGFGAVRSMTSVHIIRTEQQGQERISVSIGGDLMAAKIKNSGRYTYRIVEFSDQQCEVAFYERDPVTGEWVHVPVGIDRETGEPLNVTFSMKDAGRANLTNKFNWRAHPRKMLFWRCISIGADVVCPELFMGSVATFDDVGLDVDARGELLAGDPDGPDVPPPAHPPTTPRPTARAAKPAAKQAPQHQASGTAQRSQASLTPAMQRKLWAHCDKAGIKGDEQLVKMLMVWITGEQHSDRVPKAKFDELVAAIDDHAATLAEVLDRMKEGDESARRVVAHFKPDLLPPANVDVDGDGDGDQVAAEQGELI